MRDKLFKVNISLNENGFTETVVEAKIVKEGDKTFHIEIPDKWGDVIRKFKKKNTIGIIDVGIFYNTISGIRYGCWCFEEDIEKIKSISKDKIISTAKNYETTLNKILKHIQ